MSSADTFSKGGRDDDDIGLLGHFKYPAAVVEEQNRETKFYVSSVQKRNDLNQQSMTEKPVRITGLGRIAEVRGKLFGNPAQMVKRRRSARRRCKMYKKILIATDGSDLANRAVTHALKLASELRLPVVIVTVTQLWSAMELAHEARMGKSDPVGHFEELAAASARTILDAAAKQAVAYNVTCEIVHMPDQNPAEGIIAVANQKECDLIVMASHGRRGVDRILLGSQVNEVLAHTKIPTLVVR